MMNVHNLNYGIIYRCYRFFHFFYWLFAWGYPDLAGNIQLSTATALVC